MKSLYLFLLLALCATTPACSRFTAGGRSERAYAKYQKKLKVNREPQLAKLHRAGPNNPPPELMAPSETEEATETSESPQGVPSNLNGE
jgi:hypothetical protein